MATRLWVGTRKGLFTLRRGSGGWDIESTAFLGDNVSMMLPPSGALPALVALDHGHFGVKLHTSSDRGATWKEIPTPAYPPKPADADEKHPMSGKPIPWNTERIWALERGPGGVVWCGTIPGGLFRSGDGGATWEFIESLWNRPERLGWVSGGTDFAGIHSIAVDPRDPDHVVLAISCGGIWHTRDGGKTWENRSDGMRQDYMPPDQAYSPTTQDAHLLAMCAAAPDSMWVQHHNGVFHSTDAGLSWEELKSVDPSVFGFAVAAHPSDPRTAWTVPLKKDEWRIPIEGGVVVSRTRDGGATWQALRKGLPQRHAYDVVFRHGLDVDETGTALAIGSTTGALWISEDAGDSWTEISAHLPQVYVVRFEK